MGLGASTDYVLESKRPPKGLKTYEALVHDKLFAEGDSIRLSELKTRFFDALPQIKNDLYGGLSQRGYFAGNPTAVRAGASCCCSLRVPGAGRGRGAPDVLDRSGVPRAVAGGRASRWSSRPSSPVG